MRHKKECADGLERNFPANFIADKRQLGFKGECGFAHRDVAIINPILTFNSGLIATINGVTIPLSEVNSYVYRLMKIGVLTLYNYECDNLPQPNNAYRKLSTLVLAMSFN